MGFFCCLGDFQKKLDTDNGVLWGILVIVMTYWLTISFTVMRLRSQTFTSEFMKQFDDGHCKEIKGDKAAPK